MMRVGESNKYRPYLQQDLRDWFVCGIRHENTKKRLLTEANLTLTKEIETTSSIETAEA